MAVKQVEVFRAPSEYERSAAEARRRQRMAEMLAAQAYDPSQVVNAPIPSAAPLVQGLQAFLTARQARKAEEAAEKARTADVQSMQDLIRQLGPQERSGAEEAVADIARTAQPGSFGPDGTYTPSTITPSNMPIGMPYTEAAPTGQARQDILLQAQFGGSPRAAELAKALMGQREESPYSKINVLDADPNSIAAFERTGRTDYTVLRKRDDPSKPLLTPKDLANLRLDVAQANVNRANVLSNLPADFQSTVPSIPSVDQLLAPSAYSGFADLETGEFAPKRGLQFQGEARTATGEPISAPQKPVIERVSPKAYGELVTKQPIDKRSTQNALGQVSMMRNFINDLQQHGGTDYIFGPIASATPDIRGSATSARSLFDTLRERSSVEALKQSRAEGFAPGSITEQEWPRFETAIGAIRGAKDPRAMRLALQNADAQLRDLEQRILNNYSGTYGSKFPLEWSAPTYKPESSLYPRPETAAEDKAVFDRADQILMKMKQRGR